MYTHTSEFGFEFTIQGSTVTIQLQWRM